jgi:hypothetical protein
MINLITAFFSVNNYFGKILRSDRKEAVGENFGIKHSARTLTFSKGVQWTRFDHRKRNSNLEGYSRLKFKIQYLEFGA